MNTTVYIAVYIAVYSMYDIYHIWIYTAVPYMTIAVRYIAVYSGVYRCFFFLVVRYVQYVTVYI